VIKKQLKEKGGKKRFYRKKGQKTENGGILQGVQNQREKK